MPADRTFVDTNVLVYAVDDSEPEKRGVARNRLLEESRDRELVVSTQVLQELYVALTRGARPILPPEAADQEVRNAARLLVVQVDPSLVFSAIERSRKSVISFWDALVVETARRAGCRRLLSEDLSDGAAFGDLVVENPFRTLGGKRRRKH